MDEEPKKEGPWARVRRVWREITDVGGADVAADVSEETGSDPVPRVVTDEAGPTDAAAFGRWLRRMDDRGMSGRECARRLGCSANTIKSWRERGAPRYVGLACAAIEAGLEAVR